jgi:hypothetical protein
MDSAQWLSYGLAQQVPSDSHGVERLLHLVALFPVTRIVSTLCEWPTARA